MTRQADSSISDHLALRVPRAAKVVDMSPRSMWRLIERGEIAVVRTAGATLVPVNALEEWLRRGRTRSRGDA